MTKTSIFQILLRRKRLLLLSGVATAAIAFGVSRTLPLQWSSEGSLIVDNRATPADPAAPSVLNGVLTQIDVLQSKGLIRDVVVSLNLAHDPGLMPTVRLPAPVLNFMGDAHEYVTALYRSLFQTGKAADTETDRLVYYVQKHLSVSAQDNSSVISVKFDAGTPETAAAVVNAVISRYLTTIAATRDAGVAKVDDWISQQMAMHRAEVDDAEQRVTTFLQGHSNISEVQGSLTSAIQLSKDQDQLVLAREDLAQKQAAFDTIQKGGSVSGATEALESKTIQIYRELEAKTMEQIGSLTSIDPRRAALQQELASVRLQISNEHNLILASVGRALQIARAHVQALEASVQRESGTAQTSSVAGATLKQLTGDLDAKRQLQVSFLTQAGQARIAAEQAPIAHVLFQGVPPQRPVQTFGLISLMLGFIGGTMGAAGTVLLRGMTSIRINSPEEMTDATGLPVFGSLPDMKLASRGQGFLASPYSAPMITETFRAMWVAMHQESGQGSVILVTSSETEEGKTTIAASLAHRFADDGHRVLLIDADLRRPRLSAALDPSPSRCLESVLDGAPFEQAVLNVKPGLDCLLTNGTVENPVKVLSSERFKALLAATRLRYEFVILDSPPVLHVADPVLLARLAQHIVFVVQAGRVPNALVSEAIHRFPEDDRAKMLTLLTRVKRSLMDASNYYGGYARMRITGTNA